VPQAPVAVAPPIPAPIVTAPAEAPVNARASVPVNLLGSNFSGQQPTIQIGDTVVWTNNSPSVQTVTSDTGMFDSGRLNPGQTFSFTFNSPGSYGYHSAADPGIRSAIMVGPGDPNNQGPFFGSPSMPGYDPSYVPDYEGYGSQNPYGGYGTQNPYSGQLPYPGQGSPAGGYSQTLNVIVPPNGVVALTWLPTPNVMSYRIYDTLTSSPMNFSIAQTANQTTGGLATNALVTGLTPGASYLIQVRAVGPSGQETLAPAASLGLPGYGFPGSGPVGLLMPAALSVSSATATTATLAWTGSMGATSYRVNQSTNAAGPFTPSALTGVAGTGSMVMGLAPNTTYFFQVVAMDAQGNQSPPSNTATWTTTSGLAAPTSMSVIGVTSTTATTNWAPASSATSYRVAQSQNQNGPFTTSSMTNLTSNGATVTGLTPSTSYFFQVTALDAAGNQSVASNTAMGLTTP
jgi:plastocyanin/chitodextrinase